MPQTSLRRARPHSPRGGAIAAGGRRRARESSPLEGEAWRAPLAGGAAEREAPAPYVLVLPAPAGGWPGALGEGGARFWPPGATLDDPPARVLPPQMAHGRGGGTWDASGQSVVYLSGTKVRRLFLTSGEDTLLFDTRSEEPILGSVAVSPDGNTIHIPELVSHTRRKLVTNFGERPRPH